MIRTSVFKKLYCSFMLSRSITCKPTPDEPKLLSICPIDGRYKRNVEHLANFFSESALIKYRVHVELQWFKTLLRKQGIVIDSQKLSSNELKMLDAITKDFTVEDAQRVKDIEGITNHDMKAVEYFIKEKISKSQVLKELGEYVHFTCTSEDINNLAYGLMVQKSVTDELLPKLNSVRDTLKKMAIEMAGAGMMARTHGQPATPTTMGKELANFVYRINETTKSLKSFKASGKFNGAVGNYNAHKVTCPECDWISISKEFVEGLGLKWSPYSTQIESHDTLAELASNIHRANTILIGFCRDIWMYTSFGYFKLKVIKGEVGSSTMPHKVNPIYFENAEGNLGVANALLHHFAEKLPISRMQRDLSDSTVLRNIGSAFAYSIIAYSSILTGLNRLDINKDEMKRELEMHYELLAEPVQTVMRRYKKDAPYEQLKEFTRGKNVNRESYQKFVSALDLPADEKQKLMDLKPTTYLGYAEDLAKNIGKYL